MGSGAKTATFSKFEFINYWLFLNNN